MFLVKEALGGASAWLPMNEVGPGRFEARHHLPPGSYRFRYLTAEGATFLAGGQHGLLAHRVSDPDSRVYVEPIDIAQPA